MYMPSTGDPPQNKRFTQAKSEGIEKHIFHANGDKKKVGVAILLSARLQNKAITSNRESHCMILKGSIQQEDITLINMYVPHIGAPKYVKKILVDFK